MVSIIVPSKHEKYLERTVKGLLDNARGEIEILVVLDGYDTHFAFDDYRIRFIKHEESVGMRAGIRDAVSKAKGEYIMKIDAHCIVDEGYDVKLAAQCEDNWVVIPRRYKLDEETWTRKEPYIDYEHFIFPLKYNPVSLHGFRWDERTEERTDPLDDNMTFQGSCWFMKKSHFQKLNLLSDTGYQGVPQQEAEEIGLSTWMSGGRVVTNKNTWYAHWFKGKSGRGYHLDLKQSRDCYKYSYQHWVHENKEQFINVIEKFMPIPGWPEDWKEKLWTS